MSADVVTKEQASLIIGQTVTSTQQLLLGLVSTWRAITENADVYVITVGPCPSLQTIYDLLTKIASQTSVPFPEHRIDCTHSTVPLDFILFQIDAQSQTLAEARAHLSQTQIARVYLQLGVCLKEVHDNVQNDWFGHPRPPTLSPSSNPFGLPADLPDSAFSWQETFLEILETNLASLKDVLVSIRSESDQVDQVYTKIHSLLSRAIGSFLFDDAEIPSLSCPMPSFISEDCVFLGKQEDPLVLSLLPIAALEHAVWGDPAFEWAFTLEGSGLDKLSRQALDEGYAHNLFIFKRQKIKRAWYDLYAFAKRCATEGERGTLEILQAHVSKIEEGILY